MCAANIVRSLSHAGSDGDFAEQSFMDRGDYETGFGGGEDIRDFVVRLEDLQANQRSPQQPNPELDSLLSRALARHGPGWRQRLAVMTKSALLRKKILTMSAAHGGGRGLGCASLGVSHPWRQRPNASFSDQNWPKASTSMSGLHQLSGGSSDHDRLLRAPADKLRINPALTHSEEFSVPKAKRFPGTHHNGELNFREVQKRGTPGPGAYFKSVPRGTAFSVDGGETVVLGANHVCPWKKALGRNINPVDVDLASMNSQPSFSFSKTRRFLSDTAVGHNNQGATKSDAGILSPGHVYEQYGTMRPLVGNTTFGNRSKQRMMRSMSATLPRMRSVPVEPEVHDNNSNPEEQR